MTDDCPLLQTSVTHSVTSSVCSDRRLPAPTDISHTLSDQLRVQRQTTARSYRHQSHTQGPAPCAATDDCPLLQTSVTHSGTSSVCSDRRLPAPTDISHILRDQLRVQRQTTARSYRHQSHTQGPATCAVTDDCPLLQTSVTHSGTSSVCSDRRLPAPTDISHTLSDQLRVQRQTTACSYRHQSHTQGPAPCAATDDCPLLQTSVTHSVTSSVCSDRRLPAPTDISHTLRDQLRVQ